MIKNHDDLYIGVELFTLSNTFSSIVTIFGNIKLNVVKYLNFLPC